MKKWNVYSSCRSPFYSPIFHNVIYYRPTFLSRFTPKHIPRHRYFCSSQYLDVVFTLWVPFYPFLFLRLCLLSVSICHWVPKLCFLLMANRIPRCPFGKGKQVSLARLQKLMVLNRCLHLIFRMFKFLECLKKNSGIR